MWNVSYEFNKKKQWFSDMTGKREKKENLYKLVIALTTQQHRSMDGQVFIIIIDEVQ